MKQMPTEYRVWCADCGAIMRLRSSRHGPFYGCSRYPQCRGTHGAHADGKPLGTPADGRTKGARIAAHAAFDPLWEEGYFPSRTKAYAWLREKMDLGGDECHIGKFNYDQCEEVVHHCNEFMRDWDA